MKLLMLVLVGAFIGLFGKPAQDAKVFLEDGLGRKVIAFQNVNEKGKVTFQGLDEGDFRVLVIFPQQKGKYIRERAKHRTLAKAIYNPKTKTYFYQGDEGFFSVKFSGLKKIDSENFRAVFKEIRNEEENTIVIAELQTKRGGGQFSLKLKAITAAQFKNSTDKLENDISLYSIPHVR